MDKLGITSKVHNQRYINKFPIINYTMNLKWRYINFVS